MLNFKEFSAIIIRKYNYLNYRSIKWPRGRVLGGSSAINAMLYIRGHPKDYDRWQSEGADGWSFEDCLPYFKKSQNHHLGDLFSIFILSIFLPLCI